MKKIMITISVVLFIAATVHAQSNLPGTSPVINGSGTYAPQMNPASGQSNVVVGTSPNNTTGTTNQNTAVQNPVNPNTDTYRSTPTSTGVSSDSLSQINTNTSGNNSTQADMRTNTSNGTINSQRGGVSQPATIGTNPAGTTGPQTGTLNK